MFKYNNAHGDYIYSMRAYKLKIYVWETLSVKKKKRFVKTGNAEGNFEGQTEINNVSSHSQMERKTNNIGQRVCRTRKCVISYWIDNRKYLHNFSTRIMIIYLRPRRCRGVQKVQTFKGAVLPFNFSRRMNFRNFLKRNPPWTLSPTTLIATNLKHFSEFYLIRITAVNLIG